MVRKNRHLVWVREHKGNHLLSAAVADASWTPTYRTTYCNCRYRSGCRAKHRGPGQRNARSRKLRATDGKGGNYGFHDHGRTHVRRFGHACGTGADALRPARDRGRPALLGKKRAALRGTVRPSRRQDRRPLVCRRSPPAGMANETTIIVIQHPICNSFNLHFHCYFLHPHYVIYSNMY